MHRPSLHRNWFSVQEAKGNFAWKLVTTQKTKYRYLYTHPTWRCFEYTLMTHTHSFWCLYCRLWTYFTPCSSVSIVTFKQVNVDWDIATYTSFQDILNFGDNVPVFKFHPIKVAQNYFDSFNCLTLSWRRPLSYRNQSIDMLCKSVDWSLYGNGLRHERVKSNRHANFPVLICPR